MKAIYNTADFTIEDETHAGDTALLCADCAHYNGLTADDIHECTGEHQLEKCDQCLDCQGK